MDVKSRPTVCIVLGMAGTGKTALMQRLVSYVHTKKIASYVLNLDPAVSIVPYEPNIDIRDSVDYRRVMQHYKLGPNGAILTSLNLFATKFHEVLAVLERRAPEVDYIFIDTPGQIEAFTWSASGQIITETLAATFPTVITYVVDSEKSRDPTTFMSNVTYACSILYKTQLPFILAFNKTDVAPHLYALEWMADPEALDAAVARKRAHKVPKKKKSQSEITFLSKSKFSSSEPDSLFADSSEDQPKDKDPSKTSTMTSIIDEGVSKLKISDDSVERKMEDGESTIHEDQEDDDDDGEDEEEEEYELQYGDLTYMDSLVKHLGLVLHEFYQNIRTVGISAKFGIGMDEFMDEISQAKSEYLEDYWPMIEERMKENESRDAEVKRQTESADVLMEECKRPSSSQFSRSHSSTSSAALSDARKSTEGENPFASDSTAMWSGMGSSMADSSSAEEKEQPAQSTLDKLAKLKSTPKELLSESERFDMLSDYELMKLIHDEELAECDRKADIESFGRAFGVSKVTYPKPE